VALALNSLGDLDAAMPTADNFAAENDTVCLGRMAALQ